ncbi:hypothetical protein [Streptomyces sp. AM6-12]|uniref:hypothetical protein n=1 Tax=Streptomyces sp. AM6-12 TaxID=3345149 RepID=UPI0037A1D5C0
MPGGTPERTLLTGLDLDDPTESAFSTEYFGPVLGVAELPGTGAAFLGAAVAAVNDRLHGTLGAHLIAHPTTIKELGFRLRYGTIAVNAWTGVGYATPRATWGAYPGHTLDRIQSGIGVVHNALLLAGTERTLVTGPFRPAPRSILHGEASISPKPRGSSPTPRPPGREDFSPNSPPTPAGGPPRSHRLRRPRLTPPYPRSSRPVG